MFGKRKLLLDTTWKWPFRSEGVGVNDEEKISGMSFITRSK